MSSECVDKKLGRMLHAYEIGMLNDEDRRRFELHMLECHVCFEQAKDFADFGDLAHSHPDRVLAELKDDRKPVKPVYTILSSLKSLFDFKHYSFRTTSLVGLTIIVLILLVLQPWHIEVRPIKDAVAGENILTVMYFENIADSQDAQKLSDIATNLLITDLAESHYLHVIPAQRLNDLMNLLGKRRPGAEQIDEALDMSRKLNAKWIVLGSLLQITPNLVVTYQLFDVEKGYIIASQKIVGNEEQDIFAVIDELSVHIKSDLSLPAGARTENDPNSRELTTQSSKAYEYYLMGLDFSAKLYAEEARNYYRKALEHDSAFAMAYYRLSFIDDRAVQPMLINKATKYSKNISRKYQHYISSRAAWLAGGGDEAIRILKLIIDYYPDEKEAYFQLGTYLYRLGEYSQSVEYFNKAIQIDPLYKQAHSYLPYAYDKSGEFEKAILALDQYADLTPGEANPYDSKGEFYLKQGEYDKAIEAFEKAIAIKSDFMSSLMALSGLNLERHHYQEARQYFSKIATSSSWYYRLIGRLGEVNIALYRGEFYKALGQLDNILEAKTVDKQDSIYTDLKAFSHLMKSKIYYELGDNVQALDEFNKYETLYISEYPDSWLYYHIFKIHILAESGDLTAANYLAKWFKERTSGAAGNLFGHYYSLGSIAFVQEEYNNAAENFEKAMHINPNYHATHMLAKAYFYADKKEQAVELFNKIDWNRTPWNVFNCIWFIKRHYYLGQLYEQSQWDNKAINEYQQFLNFWGEADPPIKEVAITRTRLTGLENKK